MTEHQNGKVELSDKVARDAAPPAKGYQIIHDKELSGFGLRITAKGAKAWILIYRIDGLDRSHTIGRFPTWDTKSARSRARELRKDIDRGNDPQGDRTEHREAWTINQLADEFELVHLPKRSAITQREYKSILKRFIRKDFGNRKAVNLTTEEIAKWHAKIARETPYQANRALAVFSKLLAFGGTKIRPDNPCKGVEKAREDRRERFLSPAEIGQLSDALAVHPEQISANAIRLLMLTGARKGETLQAKWSDFDLDAGTWTKPAHTTKTKKLHRVPLSEPALELLRGMKADADGENARRAKRNLPPVEWVFPSIQREPLKDVKKTWAAVCKGAKISGVRIHDLRHTYASILASQKLSLPIIGALLGHTQAATTQRYAHLLDDPLREATKLVGNVISSAGKIAPLPRKNRAP